MEVVAALLSVIVVEAKRSKRGDPQDNTLSPTPTSFTSTTLGPTPSNFVADVDMTRSPSAAPTPAPLKDYEIGLIAVASFFVIIVILGTWYRIANAGGKKMTEENPLLSTGPSEDPAGETSATDTWQNARGDSKPTVLPGPPVSSI